MKTFHHTFICILICLVPALLAGQALQVQNQLPGISSPASDSSRNSFRMTDPPLLRLSHEGPAGLEMVKLELIPLSLQSTGPIILLDQRDPLIPGDAVIRLIPNFEGSRLNIENYGPSGQDGIRLKMEGMPVHNSFFDVFYDLQLGKFTHSFVDPDASLMRETTFDKATPKLLERISSNNPGMESFFDVFYDLQIGKITHSFIDPDAGLLRETTFDKSTPKLLERISSNNPGMNSFFDVFYDLQLGKFTHSFVDPDASLMRETTFDKATPKLLERISSNNPGMESFFDVFYDLQLGKFTHSFVDPDASLMRETTFDKATPKLLERISSNTVGLDSFFDIFYDLQLARTGIGFGFEPNNICLVSMFDPATPKLTHKISSDLPSVESFFDITYDLSLERETRRFARIVPEDPDFDLLLIREYDRATPKLLERIESSDPSLAGSFFDITYDLNYGGGGGAGKTSFSDLSFSTIFIPDTPRLQQVIASANPMFTDQFFDITYDLNYGGGGGTGKTSFQDLHFFSVFQPGNPEYGEVISSTNPEYADNFFDIAYNLDLGTIKTEHNHNAYTMTSNEPATICWKFESMLPSTPDFFDICYDMDEGSSALSFHDMLWKQTFDPAVPKFTQRLLSELPQYSDSFFDITYDLSLKLFKLHLQDFHFDCTFNPEIPKLTQRVVSDNPVYADRFFDITYDLNLRQAKIMMEDLLVTRSFDSATPRLTERIQSALLPYLESFFDITYDIEERSHKIILEDLIVSQYFLPEIPKLQQTISSLNPMMLDHFFDITYDLDLGKHSTKHRGLVYAVQYRESEWDFVSRISSEDPTVPGFFDVNVDIGIGDLITETIRAGQSGTTPLEMRYEYDGLSRLIREVSSDANSGATLLLERNLSPSSPRLVVGGSLRVNGGAISSDAGPLLVTDDVQMIGAMVINGSLQVNGPKMFRIDHPLDPENKYLIHSCIESPDMMNVYNGNIMTDENGYATVKLPDYFEALNKDFRYQLTCIGQFAQAIVDQKVADNKFVIRTDKPDVEVSWQVTGIRQDKEALKGKLPVEMDKVALGN